MRTIVIVLILIFNLQSWTKADVIRDFEIEGVSIGDSLLDFITLSKIKNLKKSYYPNSKKFIMVDGSFDQTLKNYDNFYVTYLDNKRFIIHEIKGIINFNETNECINQRDKIASNIRVSFKESIKNERNYIKNPAQDNSGKSKNYSIDFEIEDGKIRAYCIMWSKDIKDKKNWSSHLAIIVYDKKFRYFLMNEAFK
jgi:hypothetical protein